MRGVALCTFWCDVRVLYDKVRSTTCVMNVTIYEQIDGWIDG